MDTSETYIKMCDCEEIQKDKGVPLGPTTRRINRVGDDVFTDLDIGETTWRTIWLPRQDQIQEMLYKDDRWLDRDDRPFKFPIMVGENKWNYILRQFIRYNDMASIEMPDKLGGVVFSFEQLWLAFYMYEKHQKGWDGSQWRNC